LSSTRRVSVPTAPNIKTFALVQFSVRQLYYLETPMLPKKTTLVLQLAMTFMMALTMSGTLGFIFNGADFVSHWPQTFIIAWPIAFIYTRIINPIAFKIAFKFAPPHKAA
jgi:membrane-associated PAP2 superfamily phosphatase